VPWKETHVIDERMSFVVACKRGDATMTELCELYRISRKTGYKLLARFASAGITGLEDRSRAPHRQGRQTPTEVEAAIVAFKGTHPRRGPRKIKVELARQEPGICWPAASTIGDILKRHGLVAPRRRRHRTPPYTNPLTACHKPNDLWCADFKGWFRTGDGRRCDPFTLTDADSRYLLRCQIVSHPDYRHVKPIMDAAFREYGLPRAIRTDNGPPFASRGLGGLSRLSITWIRLGIIPERIEPGHPEQNPRHERMHLTLKDDSISPPKANARRQQSAFDDFQEDFNHHRPHEALGQHTPASVYQPSPRPCPRRLPRIEYPEHYQVRRVHPSGTIRWQGREICMGRPLIGEYVGLTQQQEDRWAIYFGPVLLAKWNQRRQRREKPGTPTMKDNHDSKS
jgi:transposase InsO family protein